VPQLAYTTGHVKVHVEQIELPAQRRQRSLWRSPTASHGIMSTEWTLPLDRLYLLNPGQTLDVGESVMISDTGRSRGGRRNLLSIQSAERPKCRRNAEKIGPNQRETSGASSENQLGYRL